MTPDCGFELSTTFTWTKRQTRKSVRFRSSPRSNLVTPKSTQSVREELVRSEVRSGTGYAATERQTVEAADWERIEAQYRAGTLTTRQIAAEHGISHTAINKRAKAHDWTRDLSAQVRAKADALVSRALVSTEVSSQAKATEKLTVEVEAQVQARIRHAHRRHVPEQRQQKEAP